MWVNLEPPPSLSLSLSLQPHSFLPGSSSPFLGRPPALHHPHPHPHHHHQHHHHHGAPPPHVTFVPQPSTPDKLQGEPWDFHSPTPGALYGAIGSGLPSNAATQPFSQTSFSIQAPPSSGKTHGAGEVWSKPSSVGVALSSSSSLSVNPTLPPPPPPTLPPLSVSSYLETRIHPYIIHTSYVYTLIQSYVSRQ